MEGLQIERYDSRGDGHGTDGMYSVDDGKYVRFSDAERFHTQLQEALEENMKLTVERDELLDEKERAEHFSTLRKGDG